MTNKDKVLAALTLWMNATHAFDNCERGLDKRPITVAGDALADAIFEFAGRGSIACAVVASLSAVSQRFISDEYGDDDTDAPCDVEWAVHSLVASLDKTHVIPEEIEPAHVADSVFPHPSDEE